MIAPRDLDLVRMVESADEAWDIIRDFCTERCGESQPDPIWIAAPWQLL
nr:hypothetical protein [Iodidimonas nitroreducens]